MALAGVLAGALSVACLPQGPGAGQPASFTPALSGVIAFSDSGQLWTMDAASRKLNQATHFTRGRQTVVDPALSFDGRRVAYVLRYAGLPRPVEAELHVANADGGDDRVVVRTSKARETLLSPAWQGSGQILYVRQAIQGASFDAPGQHVAIESVDSGGGEPSVFADNAEMPGTSPGGAMTWVSHASGYDHFQLVVRTEGNTSVVATDRDFDYVYSPRLSASGEWLVFSAAAKQAAAQAGWQWVAVAQAHGAAWDPWIVRRDGQSMRRLAALGGEEQSVAFAPDGNSVAAANATSITVIGVNGGRTQLSGPNYLGADAWGLDWR
jgi:Tol biopolymer transport system component